MGRSVCTPRNRSLFSCTADHIHSHTHTQRAGADVCATFILREIDVTKYFSVNQSFWIICKSIGRFGHLQKHITKNIALYWYVLHIITYMCGAGIMTIIIIIMSARVRGECVSHSNTEWLEQYAGASDVRWHSMALPPDMIHNGKQRSTIRV